MTTVAAPARLVIAGSDGTAPLSLPNVVVTSASHLKVYADKTLLTNGVHYTVSQLNNTLGPLVQMNTDAYSWSPTKWVLRHVPPTDQGTTLAAGGKAGSIFETALDALTRRVQSIEERVARAVRVHVDQEEQPDRTYSPQAGRVPQFTGDGGLEASELDTEGLDYLISSAPSFAAAYALLQTYVLETTSGRFSSVAALQAANIPGVVRRVDVMFHSPLWADLTTLKGGGPWVRIDGADIGNYPSSAIVRSVDRWMPDGTEDVVDGGYWLVHTDTAYDPTQIGARGDAVFGPIVSGTDDGGALVDWLALMKETARPGRISAYHYTTIMPENDTGQMVTGVGRDACGIFTDCAEDAAGVAIRTDNSGWEHMEIRVRSAEPALVNNGQYQSCVLVGSHDYFYDGEWPEVRNFVLRDLKLTRADLAQRHAVSMMGNVVSGLMTRCTDRGSPQRHNIGMMIHWGADGVFDVSINTSYHGRDTLIFDNEFYNCDTAVFLSGSANCTVDKLHAENCYRVVSVFAGDEGAFYAEADIAPMVCRGNQLLNITFKNLLSTGSSTDCAFFFMAHGASRIRFYEEAPTFRLANLVNMQCVVQNVTGDMAGVNAHVAHVFNAQGEIELRDFDVRGTNWGNDFYALRFRLSHATVRLHNFKVDAPIFVEQTGGRLVGNASIDYGLTGLTNSRAVGLLVVGEEQTYTLDTAVVAGATEFVLTTPLDFDVCVGDRVTVGTEDVWITRFIDNGSNLTIECTPFANGVAGGATVVHHQKATLDLDVTTNGGRDGSRVTHAYGRVSQKSKHFGLRGCVLQAGTDTLKVDLLTEGGGLDKVYNGGAGGTTIDLRVEDGAKVQVTGNLNRYGNLIDYNVLVEAQTSGEVAVDLIDVVYGNSLTAHGQASSASHYRQTNCWMADLTTPAPIFI